MYNQPLTLHPGDGRTAATLLRQLQSAGDIDQYKRELVQNAVEAGATNIEAGAIRLADLGAEGGIKAAFIDNGRGMSAAHLGDYIGELFNGASDTDAQGNFKMGGRVSSLPPNPMGVIWASWTSDDPEGAFIHIRWNAEAAVYESVSQNGDEGMSEFYMADDDRIGIPPAEWQHSMITKTGHGTVVILLGSAPEDHTVGAIAHDGKGGYVYPMIRRQRTDWQYYNAKFWELPEKVKRLAFMWAEQDLVTWQAKIAPGEFFVLDPSKTMSFRTHQGLQFISQKKAESFGSVQVEGARGKALVHWAIWPDTPKTTGGEMTSDESVPLGLFGELFQNEVYALAYRDEQGIGSRGLVSSKLGAYGIGYAKVKSHIAIIVEPLANDNFMPASVTPSRHELRLAGAPLPHDEWGESFALQMPAAIKARIAAVSGETDEDLMKRLKDDQTQLAKFFSRLIAAIKGKKIAEVGDVIGDDGGTSGDDSEVGGVPGNGQKCPPHHVVPHPSPDPPMPVSDPLKPRHHGPKIGGGIKKRQSVLARGVSNVDDPPVTVKWVSGQEFEGEYDGLAARNEGSRTVLVNGDHPYVKQLVADSLEFRRASAEDQSMEKVKNAISATLARYVMAAEGYRRTEVAGLRGHAPEFKSKALSDEALTAVLLNVLTMKTIIANTFRGSRVTTRMK